MSPKREMLYSLIDNIDEREFDIIYRILLKFISEDDVKADELEAIKQAKKEIANGEIYSHDEVWNG